MSLHSTHWAFKRHEILIGISVILFWVKVKLQVDFSSKMLIINIFDEWINNPSLLVSASSSAAAAVDLYEKIQKN